MAGVSVTVTGPNSYSATGTTDGTGNYTFTTTPVGGGYTVTATAGASTATKTGVNVAAGLNHVTLSMPTGQIRASVSIGGNPLAGQTVTLTGPNSFSATGTTDSTGLHVFSNLPVGTGYTASTTYGSTVQQTGLAVTPNGHTNALLVIPSGSLKVTVQNQSSTPIPGALLTMTTTNGVIVAGRRRRLRTARTPTASPSAPGTRSPPRSARARSPRRARPSRAAPRRTSRSRSPPARSR